MTSYKPEIQTHKGWASNNLRFPTEGEAQAWADALYRVWVTVQGTRVTPSEEPATHVYVNKKAVKL